MKTHTSTHLFVLVMVLFCLWDPFSLMAQPNAIRYLSAGAEHNLEIRNGTLWAWGSSQYGKLGTDYSNYDVGYQVGSGDDWVSVSAGTNHSLGIKADGTLWAWGYNANGQLGDGTTTNRNSPVQIGTATDWVSVSAGGNHSLGIKADGALWGWGSNSSGKLGDGTIIDKTSPIQIGSDKWRAVVATSNSSLGIKEDGTLWAWGKNSYGSLGDGTITDRHNPVQIGSDSWITIAANGNHSLGIKADGTLWTWGYNLYGQLGDGTTTDRHSPVQIGTERYKAISSGYSYSLGIRADGTLWGWGGNGFGQLGDGTNTSKAFPVQIGSFTDWVSVSAGGYHTAGIRANGQLLTWGWNHFGQLGQPGYNDSNYPIAISGSLNGWFAVATGSSHTIAIKANGTLWTWGNNANGQLGDGTTTDRHNPVQVGTDRWIAVSAGDNFSLAIRSDGSLWAWGNNSNGQLGNGTTTDSHNPVQIVGTFSWIAVSAGASHSLAIRSDGSLWAWGNNSNGQLGNGTTTDSHVPIVQLLAGRWIAISAGGSHSFGIRENGRLRAWGNNSHGQLGDFTTTDRHSPVSVEGSGRYKAVSAGNTHGIGLRVDGTLWTWGNNADGQLGDGTTTDRHSPVQEISGDNKWTSLSAGYVHSAAGKSNGNFYLWGGWTFSGGGSYGISPTFISPHPYVISLTKGGMGEHFGIIKSDRQNLCLSGLNNYGQLGDETTTSRFGSYTCSTSPSFFITEWNTEATTGFTLITTGGGYNYDVYWESVDTPSINGVFTNRTGNTPITGLEPNTDYRVYVSGAFPRFYMNNISAQREKLRRVTQWGDMEWTSFENAFLGCSNLEVTATDTPDLSGVTSMAWMFANCSSLTGSNANWNWNTASVTNMQAMFQGATAFNGIITSWNTSSVTNMRAMFDGAASFDRNVGLWNSTVAVTDMEFMFRNAAAFNRNLGNWKLNGNVTLDNMLDNSGMDCNNYTATLTGWSNNPSTPDNKNLGAAGLNYNYPAIAVRNNLINNKGWTINDAGFDPPACGNDEFITRWNLSNDPGSGADQITFNVAVSGTVHYEWEEISGANTGSGSFGASPVTITGLPENAQIRLKIRPDSLQRFYIDNGTDRSRLTNIEQWGTVSWTSMENAFYGCNNMNSNAEDVPDLSGVTDMGFMFGNCSNLTNPVNIGNWNVSTVTDMQFMFGGATAFNSNIGSWNTDAVTNMRAMFDGAAAFNKSLDNWNTAGVTDMESMFRGATHFNHSLGNWMLNSSVNMANMLDNSGMDCENYNSTLIGWNANSTTPNGKTLGAAGLSYGPNAMAARDNLTATKGWTINDDSLYALCEREEFITVWDLSEPGVGSNSQITFFLEWISLQGVSYTWEEIGGTNTGSGTFSGMAPPFSPKIITGLPPNALIRLRIRPENVKHFRMHFEFSGVGTDTLRLMDVEQWGIASWTSMQDAFHNCSNLNITATDIPDLSGVTDMRFMFADCSSLTDNNANWNWNTTNVTNMQSMFQGATAFNADISSWNTGAVTDMQSMFDGAVVFDQNLGNWALNNNVALDNMFDNSGMNCANYSATLNGWSVSGPDGRILGAVGLNYNNSAVAARNNLISNKNWIITGDAQFTPAPVVDNVTTCDSYTLPGGNHTWASSGIYTDTILNSAGCDSVVTVNLTINANTGVDVITVCESYTWIDGITYTASNNTATHTLTNAADCDSVVTLNLTINANTGVDVITACDSYTWIDGITYTASNNTATHTLTNAADCDSVVTLNLTINANTGVDVITVCDSYTWIDGITYTASNNTATHTLTNAADCDSVVTLNLTINANTGTDVITVCDSYTWIDGITYTTSNNTATHTLTNAADCDSVVTLNLTINANTGVDVITACDSYTWIDGITYTTSNNTATHTLMNAADCDSVVALNLTITTVDISVIQDNHILTANAMGADYQWLDCDNDYAIIPGETGQSFTVIANGNYAVEITENNCTDTSDCFVVSTVGIYEESIKGLTFYPNPTGGKVFIDLGTDYEDITFSVVNALGQLIQTDHYTSIQNVELNITGEGGVYFIRISSDNQLKHVVKVIKVD